MSSNGSTNPDQLGDQLHEVLTLYHAEVVERVNEAGAKASKKLLRLTRASAPVGLRKGRYKRALNIKTQDSTNGAKEYIWNAGAENRLTHLLVKGHATVNGGRTQPDPFLQNALDTVLPEYEHDVEEAVQSD